MHEKLQKNPEKELSPLEKLGIEINAEVEKTGKIEGEVSFVEHAYNVRKYPVTRSFAFLGKVVQENVEYDSPWRLRERVIRDCLNDLERITESRYLIQYEHTASSNKKYVVIKKSKESYSGPIIIPQGLSTRRH